MSSTFSVEMKSKTHVRTISISDEAHDRVLFEGDLGRLLKVSLIEGYSLEVIGANGVLRIEITENVLKRVLTNPKQELSLTPKEKINNEKFV